RPADLHFWPRFVEFSGVAAAFGSIDPKKGLEVPAQISLVLYACEYYFLMCGAFDVGTPKIRSCYTLEHVSCWVCLERSGGRRIVLVLEGGCGGKPKPLLRGTTQRNWSGPAISNV
ncbi:unnamed protein product, partial [Ectocarpus sp. 8 AP-2014]